ncbi:bacteriocin-like protein [Chryseobacterium sp. 2987]|uniref:bacteriocin-like protein n=2 Tax=Chryseobacterium TaxID=59732 RepID=UPI0038D48CA5
MKNLKKLTRENMKSVQGGFACYCNGTYKGEYSSVIACVNDCGVSTGPTKPTEPTEPTKPVLTAS